MIGDRRDDGGQLRAGLAELREAAMPSIYSRQISPSVPRSRPPEQPPHVAVLCKGEPVPDRPDRIRDRLRHTDGGELGSSARG